MDGIVCFAIEKTLLGFFKVLACFQALALALALALAWGPVPVAVGAYRYAACGWAAVLTVVFGLSLRLSSTID